MKILSIAVEGLGCFVEPRAVTFNPDLVNVLYAPNGSGKSTLLRALTHAFVTSHRSLGDDVKLLQPWGRKVGPLVRVEFDQNGAKYQLEKRFIKERLARLSRHENGVYARLFEGEDAENELRKFLGGDGGPGERANTRRAYFTGVLWSPQGQIQLNDVDESVQSRVRSALGAQQESGPSGRIEKQVIEIYDEDWSPTGKLKTGKSESSVVRLRREMEGASAQIEQLNNELRDMDRLRQDVSNGRMQLETTEREKREAASGLAAAQTQKTERDSLAAQERELRLIDESESARYEALDKALKRLEQVQTQLAQADEELNEARSQCGGRGDDDVRQLEERARLASRATEAANQLNVARAAASSAGAALAKAEIVTEQLRMLQSELSGVTAPEPRVLQRLEQLERDLESKRVELDNALVHLDIESERALAVTVREGDPAGTHALDAGAHLRVSGSPGLEVHVEGVGLFRASGPKSSAAELRAQIIRLEAELNDLLTPWLPASRTELAERRQRADELLAQVREKKTELQATLSERSMEEWRIDAERWQGQVSTLLDEFPAWRDAAPSVDHLKTERRDVDAGLSALRAAVQAVKLADQKAAQSRNALAESRKEVTDEAASRKEMNALALSLHGRGEKRKEIAAKLQALPADLDEAVERCTDRVARLDRDWTETREGMLKAQALLEAHLRKAPYASLSEAEERGAQIESDLRREELRANAAKLLWKTMEECKAEMESLMVGPVEERATALLDRITAHPLGAVRLSASLAPSEFAPQNLSEEVKLNVLSGGEHEQVHFATRLALADVLCENEPQLVVFDDALMATDGERMKRILEMLEERRERMQVLLLTCHPERYRSLRQPALIELA